MEESVAESSNQYWYMIGYEVYKTYGEKIYEGSVESYDAVTDTFKVVCKNGCFDEVEGDDLISYLVRHRNNVGGPNPSPFVPAQPLKELPYRNDGGGGDASPSAPAQPSKELPFVNDGGGQNASLSAPAQPSKPSKELPCGNNGGGKNASPSGSMKPSLKLLHGYATEKMTNEGSNNKGSVKPRPLMPRAEIAGGSSHPKRARKRRAKSSSIKCLN